MTERGRTITFRDPEQFVKYLTATKITEVFVYPNKKKKYGDEFDGAEGIFEAASEEKTLLLRYNSTSVIPRRCGTDVDDEGRVTEEFKSKMELIEGLRRAGASSDLIKKLTTTKATELQEFFDSTKTEQAGESAETNTEEKTTKSTRTSTKLRENTLDSPFFRTAEIIYDGHKYRMFLTLKVTPADAAQKVRGMLKEKKIEVFDARLTLWQQAHSGD